MTTNNNRYFAIIFPSALLAVALVLILFMFSGCNVTNRAERKLDKSIRLDRMPFTERCASDFPGTDSVHEKIVFKPGTTLYDTVFTTEVEVLQDTVYVIKTKTVTLKTVDTAVETKYVKVVDRAKEEMQAAVIKKQDAEIAKYKERDRIKTIALLVLSAYTLLRWILRKWGVKLP